MNHQWYYYCKPVTVLKETAMRVFVDPATTPFGLKTIRKDDNNLCHVSKLKGHLGKAVRQWEAIVKQTEKRARIYDDRLSYQREELNRLKAMRDGLSPKPPFRKPSS